MANYVTNESTDYVENEGVQAGPALPLGDPGEGQEDLSSLIETGRDVVLEKADEATEKLVDQAEELADKVDAILEKIITEAEIKEYGPVFDDKKAAAAYITALVGIHGIDKAAEILGIPPVDLELVNEAVNMLKEAAELAKGVWDATPTIVPLFAVFYGIKYWGAHETAAIQSDLGKAVREFKDPSFRNWNKVGYAVMRKLEKYVGENIASRIGIQLATRGNVYAAAIAAFVYRSEIYGVGKALVDSLAHNIATSEAPDEGFYNIGKKLPTSRDYDPEYQSLGGFVKGSLISRARDRIATEQIVNQAPMVGNSPMNRLIGTPTPQQVTKGLIAR